MKEENTKSLDELIVRKKEKIGKSGETIIEFELRIGNTATISKYAEMSEEEEEEYIEAARGALKRRVWEAIGLDAYIRAQQGFFVSASIPEDLLIMNMKTFKEQYLKELQRLAKIERERIANESKSKPKTKSRSKSKKGKGNNI